MTDLQRNDAPLVGAGNHRYSAHSDWADLPEGWAFGEVAAVAADRKGAVTVFSRSDHPVTRFDSEGRFLGSWGEGTFRRPHGLCVGPDDSVYCIDDVDHTVRKLTPDGRELLRLGESGRPSDTGATGVDFRTIRHAGPPFNYPCDLAVAPNGDLYVADGYGNARVHRFSPDGRLIQSWGEPGDRPGQFRIPHGIAVDADERVWIADRENCRLQIFDLEGDLLGEWPNLARPCGVFVDPAGIVYVAELGFTAGMWPGTEKPTPDATGGRVSILAPDGKLLARWGGGADPMAADDFFAPHDIWVDGTGAIYVGEVTLSAGGNRGLAPAGCPCLRKFVPA